MNEDSRNKDLAKIHIAKKQLGLDDDSYRAMLQMIAGVNSAADLPMDGRRKVLDHFRKAGFKAKKSKRACPGRPKLNQLAGIGESNLIKKIEAYLAEAKRPWNSAQGMARHMFKVDRVQWCTPEQLSKIVAALEYDARRHGRFPHVVRCRRSRGQSIRCVR